VLPFPLLGVDSDNGSGFINWHLLRWCEKEKLTFTWSRPGNCNDGAHVEQKNWAVVRTIVGYLRYDTTPELLLLNKIWKLQSLMRNFFYPQQKLVSKVGNGAKVTKIYDRPQTPMSRAEHHDAVAAQCKVALAQQYADLNPASIQRQIQGLTAQLLTLATSKGPAARRPDPKRVSADESTTTSKHPDMSHRVP